VIAGDGDTATGSCDGVGGLVRFPLVRIVSRRFGRHAVDSHHSAENGYHGTQIVSNRVRCFDHHETP
jgi:hypothetical protein